MIENLFDNPEILNEDHRDRSIIQNPIYFIILEDESTNGISYVKQAIFSGKFDKVMLHLPNVYELLYLGDDVLLKSILEDMQIINGKVEKATTMYFESDINYVTFLTKNPGLHEIFNKIAFMNAWTTREYLDGVLVYIPQPRTKIPRIVALCMPLCETGNAKNSLNFKYVAEDVKKNLHYNIATDLRCKHSYQITEISYLHIAKTCRFCSHMTREPYVEYQRR